MPHEAFAGVPPSAGTALADAVGLPPGWVVLANRALGGSAEISARIDYVLLHPNMGIALLDLAPTPRVPDAVQRLRRMLDTAQFRAIFSDYPPIIYCAVTQSELPGLRRMLEVAFGAEPPMKLSGGQSWMGSVLRLLALPETGEAAPLPSRPAAPYPPKANAMRPKSIKTQRKNQESGPGWGRPLLWGGALAASFAGLLGAFYHLQSVMAGASSRQPEPSLLALTEIARTVSPATLDTAPIAAAVSQAGGSSVPAANAAPQGSLPDLPEASPAAGIHSLSMLATVPVAVEAPPVSLPEPPRPEAALAVMPMPGSLPPAVAARPEPLRQLSPAMLVSLIRRGEEMRELGDLSAARALLVRAAEAGSAEAAAALAATWDPARLNPSQASNADPARALEWYRRAVLYGDTKSSRAVTRLEAEQQR
jgi:hypothetical protein